MPRAKPSSVLAIAGASLLALLSSNALAQAGLKVRTPTGPVTAPSANTLKLAPAKPLTFYSGFKITTGQDMSGWAPLTKGPAKGGASIVGTSHGTYIVVRGGDDGLYVAPFSAANPEISSDAWYSLDTMATSEARCRPIFDDDPKYGKALCAFLGPQGNALYMQVTNADSGKFSGSTVIDLGGQNAGAPPTFVSGPVASKANGTHFNMAVWDGGSSLFVKYDGFGGTVGTPVKDAGAWGKSKVPIMGQVATSAISIAKTAPRKISHVTFTYPATAGDAKIVASSPDLPEDASGPLALTGVGGGNTFIVARGQSGKIWQIVYDDDTHVFGKWVAEGGFAAAGSGVSCTMYGPSPYCVIQGPDGRLYGKQLSAPKGPGL